MKIENENTVARVQALKVLYPVLIITVVTLLYTTSIDLFTQKYLGLSNLSIIIFLIIVYLFFYVYHIAVKTSYIYFSDENSRIIIRYYPLRPLNPKKCSIEIPKNQFYKFSIIKTNLREEVVVYQKMGKQISKYPSFSLKGLTKEEKDNLITTLEKYSKEID